MRNDDVHVGLRVVPHSKTVVIGSVSNFETTPVWKLTKRRGQDFLYVTGWDQFQKCWLLNDVYIEGMSPEGDYFNASDFMPYNEG